MPAFAPTGDLVGLPNWPIPGRGEYRLPLNLSAEVKRDLAAFAPNLVHVASPDPAGHRAVSWARDRHLPILASVHTRFETYPRYYGLGFLEPLAETILRRFYNRCDALVAPSESMAALLREQGMGDDISIWSRGVDLFCDTIAELERRGVAHKVLVVGEGPAREFLEEKLPHAVFAGFQGGPDLGRAAASMDLLLNPSVTETFGNVTLEAMASGIPVVAARATGSTSLVRDGETGRLVEPGSISGFAEVVAAYCASPLLRAAHGAAGELRSHDYSWDAINSTVAGAYMRLVGGRA